MIFGLFSQQPKRKQDKTFSTATDLDDDLPDIDSITLDDEEDDLEGDTDSAIDVEFEEV